MDTEMDTIIGVGGWNIIIYAPVALLASCRSSTFQW